jgi:bacteriorhodopsin
MANNMDENVKYVFYPINKYILICMVCVCVFFYVLGVTTHVDLLFLTLVTCISFMMETYGGLIR